MRFFFSYAAAVTLCCFSSAPCSAFETEALSDVVTAIKSEVQSATAQSGDPKLFLKDISVEIAVVNMAEAGAGVEFKVPIVEIGASADVAVTSLSRLAFKLTPLSQTPVASQSNLGLTDAIRSLREAVKQSLNQSPNLQLDDITFQTDFVLAKDVEGKTSFWILSANAKASSSVTNSIKFSVSTTP